MGTPQAPAGAIVVISSHVARGSVGNRVEVFALERLGFEVWAVPTIVLPYHLGHGAADRIVPDDRQFAGLLEALTANGRGAGVAAVLSGFLASTGQAGAVAALIRRVKAVRPEALFVCDPVIGDSGELYVAEPLARAVRDELAPLADAMTPNAFELGWLAGEAGARNHADLARLARKLPPPVTLVTSAPALMRGHIGNLLVERDALTLIEHRLVTTPAKGTGDVVASLLTGRRLQGLDWPKAAELAVSSVFEITAATAKAGADELMLAALQGAFAQPRAPVNVRRIATDAASASDRRSGSDDRSSP